MNKITDKLTPADLLLAVIVFLLTVTPLVNDLSYAPKGWELPKVHLLQIVLVILFISTLTCGTWLLCKRRLQWKRIDSSFLILAGLISISSLLSRIYYTLPVSQMHNPLYRLVLTPEAGEYTVHMGLFGNEYRETGLITILLLLFAGWMIARNFRSRQLKLLLVAVVLTGVIQATIGITQAVKITEDLQRFSEGRVVYGTFGQNNFFAGLLLPGIAACLYFLKDRRTWIRVLALLAAGVMTAGVILSVSYFAWAVLALLFVISLMLGLSDRKELVRRLSALGLLVCVLLIPLSLLILHFAPYYAHRVNIWSAITFEYLLAPFVHGFSAQTILTTFIGSGFDTLQEKLYGLSQFNRANIDRAHNIVFDIIAFTGVTGLAVVDVYFIKVKTWLKKSSSYLLLVLTVTGLVWFTRSLIHTSSIVNLFEGVVLAAAIIAAARSESQQSD